MRREAINFDPSPDHGRDGGMNVGGRGGFIDKLMTVFVAFALLGLGCKEKVLTQTPAHESTDAGAEAEKEAEDVKEERADASAPDSGSVIPEGWQVYRNPAWGIAQLAYPAGWHSQELSTEETRDANLLVVVFSSEPIALLSNTDPVYPLTLDVREGGTLEEEILLTQNLESQTTVEIRERQFVKIRYLEELVDREFESYLLEMNGRVYAITGDPELVSLETVVSSFQSEVP
ncbi:hypothetical protein HYW17_01915 [Candidatus Uhrbacteria bacterium]|nr:hypothetical protein [Candidatus Uhrbacteria bacterium]